MKFYGTFTSQLMSNLTTKMTPRLPLKLMVCFSFLKFRIMKLLETLHAGSKVKINIFQINIFEEIILLLIII